MKNIVYYFKTAFIAEHIKKRGAGVYTLSLIIGCLSPLILFISRLNGSTRYIPRVTHNVFFNFIENALELFAYYMLPFLIILVASRITQLDHKNKGWQLMETLPIEKYANYFSKFSILIIANIIAIIAFVALSVLFVYVLSITGYISGLGMVELPFAFLFNLILRLVVASLFLSGLQFVLSVIFSNFLWPIFIGIIGFSLNTFFNESGVFFSWYPYAPISIIFRYPNGSDIGYVFTYIDYMSCVGGIVLLYIGYHWFKSKSFIAVFVGKKKQVFQTIGVLIIFGSLFVYLQKPKQFSPHNKTIIKGRIASESPIKNIYIIEPFVKDTLVDVPVKGNMFRHHFKGEINLTTYDISFDDLYKSKVFFGTNDSIQLKVSAIEKNSKMLVNGTRMVENQMLENGRRSRAFSGSIIPYIMNDSITQENSRFFFGKLLIEWQERMIKIGGYKTIDNYTLRTDFITYQKELLFIEYQHYLNEYKKRIAINFPGEQIKIPSEIHQLEQPIEYNENLLNNNLYLSSIMKQLIRNDKDEIEENRKALKAISLLDKGGFKNKLMYWQLEKSIKEASSNIEIDALLSKYSHFITSSKLKRRIVLKGKQTKSLSIGRLAPNFIAEMVDGTKITVENLKGKYTVIDVWATWCAPCRKDAPYFEKFALKYKSDAVQFVSLSVDRDLDITTWKIKAKEMSKAVLQLHSVNQKKFMKSYNIKRIPRYMVLDPEGKIVTLELSRPSKATFEKMLKESIGVFEK